MNAVQLAASESCSPASASRSTSENQFGDVRSPTRTEVRSPTRTEVRSPTSTETRARTTGNVTVTGGAGWGGTSVTINNPKRRLSSRVANANEFGAYDDAFGFSLKKIVKKVTAPVRAVGHLVGKVADSKITKGLLAGGLALTGVGLPASAAILAGTGIAGGALKKGGGLKAAVRGGATGAVTGVAAGVAGKVLPKVPGIGSKILSLRKAASGAPILGKLVPKPIGATENPESYRAAGRIWAPGTRSHGMRSSTVTSFDDEKKLDALISQPLPSVGLTPGMTTMPVIQPISPSTGSLFPEAISGVVSDAAKAEIAKRKSGMVSRVKSEVARRAKEKAIELATGVTEPPSANPTAAQGGFPAMVASPNGSPLNQNQDSEVSPTEAGVGVGGGFGDFLKSPMGLMLVAGVAFMFLKKGR